MRNVRVTVCATEHNGNVIKLTFSDITVSRPWRQNCISRGAVCKI